VKGHPFEQGFDLRLVPEKLAEPLRWTEPRMIFVNSMSDLFQQKVSLDFIMKVAETMRLANWHTYQVLTKRAKRMREVLSGPLKQLAAEGHIWWGVSVEDKKYGLPRIAELQDSPVAVRFLSVEPLLEDLGRLPLSGISWVIVGGESGPGARPMEEAWVTSIMEQCADAGVPFFFKQWGGVHKKIYGRSLRGRTYNGFPKRTKNPIPPPQVRQRHVLEIDRSSLVQLAFV
jgi:protein gp37